MEPRVETLPLEQLAAEEVEARVQEEEAQEAAKAWEAKMALAAAKKRVSRV